MTEGLYPGGLTLLKRHWFAPFDYDGKAKKPQTCLMVEMVPQEGDSDEPFVEAFSCGKGTVPVNGGKGVDADKGSKKQGLNRGSKAGRYIIALLKPVDDPEHGFPEAKVSDDIGVFDGLIVNLVRKELPKFEGQGGGLTGEQSDRPNTVLLCTEIKSMNGKVGTKAKTAAKPVAEEEAEAEAEADPKIAKKATKTVMGILTEVDGPMTVQQIGKAVFKKLKGDDDQQAVTQLVNEESFYSNESAPWTFDSDKDTLSL
jgi:hypothetical protein